MQFSIKNLIAVSAVFGFFLAFYSKFGVEPAIVGTLLLLASIVLILRLFRQWTDSHPIKRGWMIFSATFVSLFLVAAVHGLFFGELSDELLARKRRISIGQIVEFKDVDVDYFYGKGAHVHIAGSVNDIENANRLAELLSSVVDEHRKHILNVDVEIRETGTRWRFSGAGPIEYGIGDLSE